LSKRHKSLIGPKYKKVWGIYKIINTITNKVYIGSSVNLEKRVNGHFSSLRSNKHENKHLQYSFNKYGESAFRADILKTFSKNEITQRELRNVETKYISKYNSNDSSFGYNISSVGIGTTLKEFTEERKRKISEANRGRVAHNKGVPMEDSQKKLLIKVNSEKFGKSILVYDRIGNLINEFDSVRETYRTLRIPRNQITEICRGKSGHYHNLIFRYKGGDMFDRQHYINLFGCNISYSGPFYFLVENQSSSERKIFLNKRKVEIYIGLPNKDKKFQKEFKNLLSKSDEDFIVIKNYKIRFIYALSDSNIANEVRQSGLVPEV
jgi:predicted GIY-YIG superfamily endonuclease